MTKAEAFGAPTTGTVKGEILQDLCRALGFEPGDVKQMWIDKDGIEIDTFAWDADTRRWNKMHVTHQVTSDGRWLKETDQVPYVTHRREIEW